MDTISFILGILFSPLSILGKFIREDKTDGMTATFSIMFWVIGILVSVFGVIPTASFFFLKMTFLASYLLSVYFYFKVDGLGYNPDFATFCFFLVMGFICGYTTGLMGFAFFSLY